MIKYKTIKKLPTKNLFNLYQAVGWTKGINNKEKHEKLLFNVYANSNLVYSAWQENKLVGVVRAITDKYSHGLIFGLLVDPKFQKQGIGTKLISLCLKKYPKIQWSIETEKSKLKFYNKLNFVKSKNIYISKGSSSV
jgi:ribosomal protein S18 acetylase RimI-like enzyme